ncbi:unnamed protein product, partial [Ectocarpus sp. 4 AP-2014]
INPGHVIHLAQMCIVCDLLTAVLGPTLSPRMVGTSVRVRVWRTTRPLLVFLLLCSLPRSLSLPRSTAAASAQRWTLPQSSVNRRDQTRRSVRSHSESAFPTRRAHRHQQSRSNDTEPRRPRSRNRRPKGDIRINGRGSTPTVPLSSRARRKTNTAPNASVTSSTTRDDESAAPPLSFWHRQRTSTDAPPATRTDRHRAATADKAPPTTASRRFGPGACIRRRRDVAAGASPPSRTRRSDRIRRVKARLKRSRRSGAHGLVSIGACRFLVSPVGWCEATSVGKATVHVVAGALASSHSVVAGFVVGLAVWATCAKRLTGAEDDWKQVARITVEVAVMWYCHALPHGLGAGRPLRGNFGSGKAGDLLGAMWHFLGQGAFIRLVAASGRVVSLNVLEANGILLGLSNLGNGFAGSRMRRVVGATGAAAAAATTTEAHAYQLRGFFSRTNGIFGQRPILSMPFDTADTLLALQGILSATEREVVQKNGVLAIAFRDFAAQSANTLDAHSLGAVGARNLMGMGFIAARVRMFGRPALSLGWTEKATNMCMVGDPICGSLLQKLLDPTCVMLKGRGHFYDAYVACVACLVI